MSADEYPGSRVVRACWGAFGVLVLATVVLTVRDVQGVFSEARTMDERVPNGFFVRLGVSIIGGMDGALVEGDAEILPPEEPDASAPTPSTNSAEPGATP